MLGRPFLCPSPIDLLHRYGNVFCECDAFGNRRLILKHASDMHFYSFVHIDDAAGATAAALECPPGAYNIVDGNPSPQHLWLTAFARAAGAPAPPRVSEEEALRAAGPDAVYYATRLRGASNEKAGRELEFRPRSLEWILGQRSD